MSLNKICSKIRHDGRAKVVGKIALIDGEYVFYHGHKGSQRHRSLDGLAIHVSTLDWLRSRGTSSIHCCDVDEQTLWVASVKDFLEKGIRKP